MTDAEEPGRPSDVTPLVLVSGTRSEITALFEHAPPRVDYAYLLLLRPGSQTSDESTVVPPAREVTDLPADLALPPGLISVLLSDVAVMHRGEPLPPGGAVGTAEGAQGRLDTILSAASRRPGGQTAAVILSGSVSDGLPGSVALAEAGALVVARLHQTDHGAGLAAAVVEIGAAIAVEDVASIAGLVDTHFDAGGAETDPATDRPLAEIQRSLSSSYRLEFGAYKPSLLAERVEARRAALDLPDLLAYRDRVRMDRSELPRLYDAFLIGRTGFHRDPEAFAALRARVLDPLVRGQTAQRTLRVWIAGCATGEEAYSVAMELDDAMRLAGTGGDFRIIATDANAAAVEIASEGRYREAAAAAVPDALAARYLLRSGNGVVSVAPDLRSRIIFSEHDVLGESPFMDLDLIVCRNLLIALRPEPRARVLSMLRFGLRPGGFLFLGRGETPSGLEDTLQPVDTQARIFGTAQGDTPLPPANATDRERGQAPGTAPRSNQAAVLAELQHVRERGSVLQAYSALLNRFAPPSILLTGEGGVLGWFGAAKLFVFGDRTAGASQVEDLLYTDLATALRDMLDALRDTDDIFVAREVHLRMAGEESLLCHLKVESIHRLPGDWLLLATIRVEGRDPQGLGDPTEAATRSTDEHVARQTELEEELRLMEVASRRAVDRMEANSEALQTTNEELRTSNQDLQASTQHLQSANDALRRMNRDLLASNSALLDSRAEPARDLEVIGWALVLLGATAVLVNRTHGVLRLFGAELSVDARVRGHAGRVPLNDVVCPHEAPALAAAVDRVFQTGQPAECPADLRGRAVTLRLQRLNLAGTDEVENSAVMIVLPGAG